MADPVSNEPGSVGCSGRPAQATAFEAQLVLSKPTPDPVAGTGLQGVVQAFVTDRATGADLDGLSKNAGRRRAFSSRKKDRRVLRSTGCLFTPGFVYRLHASYT